MTNERLVYMAIDQLKMYTGLSLVICMYDVIFIWQYKELHYVFISSEFFLSVAKDLATAEPIWFSCILKLL